jgi:ABC-2 type transport system permease protein
MLWYKSWLETRWRFLIGLVLVIGSVCSTVFSYPEVQRILASTPPRTFDGIFGRQIAEALVLAREYRGYIWSEWLMGNVPELLTFFAVILGSGGLLAQAQRRGGAIFTLSLPVSRRQLLGVRAATGLAELSVLALVGTLPLPILSPLVGENYAIGDALVHALCLFIASSMLFAFSFFLSTVFSDVWRPVLIVLCLAIIVAFGEQITGLSRYGVYGLMSGETYFRDGVLPWLGLVASAIVTAAAMSAAVANIARQDF